MCSWNKDAMAESVIILVTILLFLNSEQAFAEEECFGDLGCFSDDTCHVIGFPPQTPEFIATRFYLYTRTNRNTPQELRRGDVGGLRTSHFDAKRKTKFSVHGWIGSGFAADEIARKDALLEVENVNVILVDWSRGADQPYSRAHQNTRVVGREIGLLTRFLNLEKGLYYRDVHLIGMSLGAHSVGYAGQFQPGFGRITGLDPAGPYFRDEGFDFRDNGPECRLDPTDAIFVDVIHTDGNDVTGAGQMLALGHVDFYPNGGRRQPGCIGSFILSPGCSHTRSISLFNESIRPTACNFTAYPCESWAQFAAGGCRDCGGQTDCATMGYYADKNTALRGRFYLETNGRSPFCVNT